MLTVRPIELAVAHAFVNRWHRHHPPTVGHRFSLGAFVDDTLVGVAVCGRPVSRHLHSLTVIEVNRLCTDGTPNACSKLYAACARAAQAMGYQRIITYTLPSEGGASLRALGWTPTLSDGGTKGWSHRPGRTDNPHSTGMAKWRWERLLNDLPDYPDLAEYTRSALEPTLL